LINPIFQDSEGGVVLDFQFKCHAGLLVIASVQHLIVVDDFVIFVCDLQ